MALLAVVDRQAAYVTLYILGAIFLVLGSAAGLGGRAAGPIAGGEADPARVHQEMQQRMSSLSQNLLLLLAGAILIGFAVLLNLA